MGKRFETASIPAVESQMLGHAGPSAPGFAGAAAQLQGRERTYAETVHALNDAQTSGQPFDAVAAFSAAGTAQPPGAPPHPPPPPPGPP